MRYVSGQNAAGHADRQPIRAFAVVAVALHLFSVASGPCALDSRTTGQPVEPFATRGTGLVERLRGRRPGLSLAQLARPAKHATKDAGVSGLVVHLARFPGDWAMAGAVRRVLESLRKADRRVVVFLPEGAGDRELYVASAASQVVISPRASVSLVGLAAGVLW